MSGRAQSSRGAPEPASEHLGTARLRETRTRLGVTGRTVILPDRVHTAAPVPAPDALI